MRDIQKNIAALNVIKGHKLDLTLVYDPYSQIITLGKPKQDNLFERYSMVDSGEDVILPTETQETRNE